MYVTLYILLNFLCILEICYHISVLIMLLNRPTRLAELVNVYWSFGVHLDNINHLCLIVTHFVWHSVAELIIHKLFEH